MARSKNQPVRPQRGGDQSAAASAPDEAAVRRARRLRAGIVLIALLAVVAWSVHRPTEHSSLDVFDDPIPLSWEIPNPDTSRMEPQVAVALSEAREILVNHPRTSAAWGRLGQLYQAHDLTAQAEYCYRHATHLAPDDVRWAYLRALMREHEGGTKDELSALFGRAMELAPELSAVPYHLGEAMMQRGEYEKAVEAFERAMKLEPDAGMIHRSLGQAYLAVNDLDRARFHLEEAADLMPEDSITWRTLARVYARLNDPERGDDAAERAEQFTSVQRSIDPFRYELAMMRMDADGLTERAGMYLRQGMAAEAAKELQWAIDAGLRDHRAFGQLALSYELLGRRDEAIKHLRIAVELQPDDHVLTQQLERLTSSDHPWSGHGPIPASGRDE